MTRKTRLLAALLLASTSATAAPPSPWMDKALDPDRRAALLEAQMTLDEKLTIVHGPMGRPRLGIPKPDRALGSAGFIPGVPRLDIPDLQEADASVGVTNPGNVRPGDGATAFPSIMALAATWSRALAYRQGVALGNEAWSKGFNVQLAGGINLMRDPRNGRTFEYAGEDPLLAGILTGDAIRGIQSQNVVSTIKHFAFNNQESARFYADAQIGDAAARESDLLAFEIGIETGKPGSVMCAYNLVNGRQACDSDWLLNQVLKRDWAYPGWVMSDWGAVHATDNTLHGLDQESGEQLDREVYFGAPLADRVRKEPAYRARLDDMVHRILRSLFAVGVIDRPAKLVPIDYAANGQASQAVAEEGAVLLKNKDDLLPLKSAKRIAIIGGEAQFGVPSGGGSSSTIAIEGPGLQIPVMGTGVLGSPRLMIYHPSAPVGAIHTLLPDAELIVDDGRYPSSAARVAASADVAIVFVAQWATESYDIPDLSLPNGQDATIAAVAAANPRTIVVLESGGPVLMPWLDKISSILEVWYPGGRGGQAIANLLTGRANPSGRLPVSFPTSLDQLPRPELIGAGANGEPPPAGTKPLPLPLKEGADVGYRWYARQKTKPLFPFGYGRSYSSFAYSELNVTGGLTITATFTVRNTSRVAGADVPQLYLTSLAGTQELRLIGWDKLQLAPGESRRVTLTADRRLLARFDEKAHAWRIPAGRYEVALGTSAADLGARAEVTLQAASFKP